MKKYIHDLEITENQSITGDYFVLWLRCPEVLPEIMPGQFAQLLVHNSPTTYLRRPISIYDINREKNELALLIKKVGDGTRALAELKRGETLNLVYPLGNWFSLPAGEKALLVGGGVGIAPMLMLAIYLHEKGYKPDVLIGGRTKNDIIGRKKFLPYGEVFITTDDGSEGEKGWITSHSLFKERIKEYSAVYTCGPDPMMRALAKVVHPLGIPLEVSLENLMACGIGACLCCVAETTEGNKTTCVDGPVFNSLKLKW